MSGLFFASFFFEAFGILIAVCAVVLLVSFGRMKGFKAVDYAVIALFFTVSVAVNRGYTYFVYDKITAYSGTEGSFCGEITDYSIYDNDLASYTVKGRINGSQKARITLLTSELDADYGDIISLEKCTFSPVESDYLFDSVSWNKSRHIYLEAEKISGISVEKRDSQHIRRTLNQFRRGMISKLCTHMSGETGAMLSGMIFGEKQYLDDNVRKSLNRSGIGHILAVSGLHVSIIAAMFMGILKKIRLNKLLRFGILNIFLFLLLMLTNFPVSAIRAVIMLDMLYSAELFAEQNDSLNSLSIAALLICICDCYAVYSSGFILSLSGTLGIAVFAPYMTEKIGGENFIGRVKISLLTAVCTTLAVMPASMYYFDEVSLISPVANILLVPLCICSMLAGIVFIATVGIFAPVLYPAELMLSVVVKITDSMAKVSIFTLPRTENFLPILFIVSAGIIAAVYLFTESRKAVSTVLAAAVFVNTAISSIYGAVTANRLTIAVLGEKNSMAAVISKGSENIVVDMGGTGNNEKYAAKYLTRKGIRDIDCLVLTGNTDSKYSAYLNELNYCEIEAIQKMADITDTITLENDAYTAEINGGILHIAGEECDIVFLPAKADYEINGALYIYYGNIPKSADLRQNSIVLNDFGNNFEIIPESEGEYKIRRNYGSCK